MLLTNTFCAIHGISLPQVREVDKSASHEAVGKLYAKAASVAYKAIGVQSGVSLLFDKIASSPWDESYAEFTRPVMTAMGRVEGMEKQALSIKSLVGGALGSTSGLARNATALALLLGAGGGTAAYLANRGVQQDSAENAILEQKIRTYNKLTHDIEEELVQSGALDTPGTEDEQAILKRYNATE